MSTDLRQTDSWAKYLGGQGWGVEELKVQGSNFKVKAYIRKIPLVGSVVKIQRPAEIPPQEEIDRIAKKHRALFVKLEPLAVSKKQLAGFELDKNPNLPTRTIRIDLTKSEEELWKNLSQDARQSVRKARSKQLTADSYQFGNKNFEPALRAFHGLLKETGRRQKFWTGSFEQLQTKVNAFGKDALVFLVYRTGNAVAGALVLVAGDTASFRKETSRSNGGTAFYHHTASSRAGRELFAPYLLMWEIFKGLKAAGSRQKVKYLEFEGVADPRFPQTKKWEGFTVFKRKWGGEELEFPAPLVKHYHPLVKALFRLSQKIAVV